MEEDQLHTLWHRHHTCERAKVIDEEKLPSVMMLLLERGCVVWWFRFELANNASECMYARRSHCSHR